MSTLTTTAVVVPRGRVTQVRVLTSEWIKLRTLRSTYITLLVAIVAMIGFGMLICWATESHWATMPPPEKAHFEAASRSLAGYRIAQLAVGVLGVMVVTGEYSTGMIRATLSAVPRRLPVLWAKAAVFAAVTVVLMAIASVVAFYAGQAVLSAQHIQVSLTAPGVTRIVLGTALYLTVVGLLGVGLGAVVRSTPGGIASVFGVLLVLPALAEALPSSWADHVNQYLPSNAGESLLTLHTEAHQLTPWTGFLVFALYAVAALVAGAVVLKRRDA
ncbi:ABC transporter permease [Streptantibioticus parmotrematis]|uniref:ABC transporter permease n=1 Tax=Streptantibioticus parmotrematis TaxID=2873249 RepID=UPI0033F25F8C